MYLFVFAWPERDAFQKAFKYTAISNEDCWHIASWKCEFDQRAIFIVPKLCKPLDQVKGFIPG